MAEKVYAFERKILDLALNSGWNWAIFRDISSSKTDKDHIYQCRHYLVVRKANTVMHFLRGPEINSNACAMKIEGFEWLQQHYHHVGAVEKMKIDLFDSLFGDGNLYHMIIKRSMGNGVRSKWNDSAFDL